MRDELQTVLDAVQVEITRSYTDALTDGDKNGRLRDYIEKCVLDGGYADAIDYDKLVDGCPTAIGVTDAEVTLERGNGFGLTVRYTLKIPVSWNGRTFGSLSVPMRVSSFYEEKER